MWKFQNKGKRSVKCVQHGRIFILVFLIRAIPQPHTKHGRKLRPLFFIPLITRGEKRKVITMSQEKPEAESKNIFGQIRDRMLKPVRNYISRDGDAAVAVLFFAGSLALEMLGTLIGCFDIREYYSLGRSLNLLMELSVLVGLGMFVWCLYKRMSWSVVVGRILAVLFCVLDGRNIWDMFAGVDNILVGILTVAIVGCDFGFLYYIFFSNASAQIVSRQCEGAKRYLWIWLGIMLGINLVIAPFYMDRMNDTDGCLKDKIAAAKEGGINAYNEIVESVMEECDLDKESALEAVDKELFGKFGKTSSSHPLKAGKKRARTVLQFYIAFFLFGGWIRKKCKGGSDVETSDYQDNNESAEATAVGGSADDDKSESSDDSGCNK